MSRVGAYSRVGPYLRVDAYSRGRLIKALRYLIVIECGSNEYFIVQILTLLVVKLSVIVLQAERSETCSISKKYL